MAINLSDAITVYAGLAEHVGHQIVCVDYAGGENVAIECETCGCVLIDADRPEED